MPDVKLSVIEPGTEVLVLVDGVVAVEARVVCTRPSAGALEGHSEYDSVTVFVGKWGQESSFPRKQVYLPSELPRMAAELEEIAAIARLKAKDIREGTWPPTVRPALAAPEDADLPR